MAQRFGRVQFVVGEGMGDTAVLYFQINNKKNILWGPLCFLRSPPNLNVLVTYGATGFDL
jgi:hypothetical protein